MADDTNTSDLARIMATDLPVSPAERDLAHRNRKLRQQGQSDDAICRTRVQARPGSAVQAHSVSSVMHRNTTHRPCRAHITAQCVRFEFD
jgi:hypothetical protein